MSFTAKLLIGVAASAVSLFSIAAFVVNAFDEIPPENPPAIQIQKRDFEDGSDPGLCLEDEDSEDCSRIRDGIESPPPV